VRRTWRGRRRPALRRHLAGGEERGQEPRHGRPRAGGRATSYAAQLFDIRGENHSMKVRAHGGVRVCRDHRICYRTHRSSLRSESVLPGTASAARRRGFGRARTRLPDRRQHRVNGVCLTVTSLQSTRATFGMSPETLERSTLGALRPHTKVNIERAMKPTDRFGATSCKGHVDGSARFAQ